MSFFEIILNGTAWLSSVCVVECNIKLFNKRNPFRKFYLNFLLKKQCLTNFYFIYVLLQSKNLKISGALLIKSIERFVLYQSNINDFSLWAIFRFY
jgi:hypothetical protein